MGWVGNKAIQSFVLNLSDALDADACAPVQCNCFFTFWFMLEMGIRSRGRVGQNRKKIYSAPPSASALLGLGLLTSCPAGGP